MPVGESVGNSVGVPGETVGECTIKTPNIPIVGAVVGDAVGYCKATLGKSQNPRITRPNINPQNTIQQHIHFHTLPTDQW